MQRDTRKSSSSQDGLADDEIREETTLGACLKRILDKDRNALQDADSSGARPKHKSHHKCFKKQGSLSEDYSLNEEQKLKKWREAGAALRRALAETSQNNEKLSDDESSIFGKDVWKSSKADPMNVMLDEYKSQDKENLPNESDASVESSQSRENKLGHRDYRKILEEHFRKKRAQGDKDGKKLTPGLLSVREKIKEITSRINETANAKHNKKGVQHGQTKNPTPRRLSRAPSRNPSQEVVSSESEAEPEASRHKFVPKCRRHSSTGSPKPRKKCSKEADGCRSGHSGKDEGPQYSLLVASSDEESAHGTGAAEEKLDLALNPATQQANSDVEADAIAQKLQDLVRKHQQEQHHHFTAAKPKSIVHGIKRLSAIEADSLPNLADIESSPVTDDPGGINNESENEVFLPGGMRDPDGVRVDKDNIMCSSCGSEVSDIRWFEGRRNSARSPGTASSGQFLGSVPDSAEISEGKLSPYAYTNSSEEQNLSHPDDFADLEDLDLHPHSSQSDQDEVHRLHLNEQDLEKLPILASDTWCSDTSSEQEDTITDPGRVSWYGEEEALNSKLNLTQATPASLKSCIAAAADRCEAEVAMRECNRIDDINISHIIDFTNSKIEHINLCQSVKNESPQNCLKSHLSLAENDSEEIMTVGDDISEYHKNVESFNMKSQNELFTINESNLKVKPANRSSCDVEKPHNMKSRVDDPEQVKWFGASEVHNMNITLTDQEKINSSDYPPKYEGASPQMSNMLEHELDANRCYETRNCKQCHIKKHCCMNFNQTKTGDHCIIPTYNCYSNNNCSDRLNSQTQVLDFVTLCNGSDYNCEYRDCGKNKNSMHKSDYSASEHFRKLELDNYSEKSQTFIEFNSYQGYENLPILKYSDISESNMDETYMLPWLLRAANDVDQECNGGLPDLITDNSSSTADSGMGKTENGNIHLKRGTDGRLQNGSNSDTDELPDLVSDTASSCIESDGRECPLQVTDDDTHYGQALSSLGSLFTKPDLVSDVSSDRDVINQSCSEQPVIVTYSSSPTPSDHDVEADDEFECDCSVCQFNRRIRQGAEWVTDEEEELLGQGGLGDLNHLEYSEGGDQYSINLAELTPLDLLLMREGRRELLELMFQNVIMQMLSVYPDLLGEQAPPPASPNTIQQLPIVKMDTCQKPDKDNVCPICLCNFDEGEEARRLPCDHVFHTLCIRAWLSKSGTCPVCRHILDTNKEKN